MIMNSDLLVPTHTNPMSTSPLAQFWTLAYQYSSTPNSINSLSRNDGPPASFTYCLMPLPHHVCRQFEMSSNCNSIQTVFQYQHPVTSLGLPHPYFPFSTVADLLTLWSVYIHSWWRPQGWLKAVSYILSFHWFFSATVMSTDMSQVGVTLYPSL